MTEAQAIELLDATFATAWPGASGSLPLALENEALPQAPSFGMMTIKHTTSQLRLIGMIRKYERRGWIFVKLWGQQDAGRKPLSLLADAVRGIFEGEQLGSSPSDQLTIDAGLTQELGVDDAYFMMVVQFPFRYYENR
jgi:hypothetical protein